MGTRIGPNNASIFMGVLDEFLADRSLGKLSTKLYIKPTNRYQYLNFESSHVKHNKTGIPYSQAIRFKRICSEQSDFVDNCAKLRESLKKQNYPQELLDDAVKRADSLARKALLDPQNKKRAAYSQPNLVLTHSASAPKVTAVLKKHHNIHMQSQRLRSMFKAPPRVVYRRSENLRYMLTSFKIAPPSSHGCSPCQ